MNNPDKLDNLQRSRKPAACQECGTNFNRRDYLKSHIKRKHSDKSDELLACLTKQYECEQCGDKFRLLGYLNKHKQSHKIKRAITIKCSLCDYTGSLRDNLINHYRETHNLEIQHHTYQFESFEAFQLWKSKMESETFSYFVHKRSRRLKKQSVKLEYYCHRSGYFKTKGANIRRIKTQGSNKMNGYCPANIKTIVTDGKYIVHYCGSHVGHKQEEDLCHLFLTKTQRDNIAVKIAESVSLQAILNETRDSIFNGHLERLHLLTMKDLYNIKQSYFSNESSITHQNDISSGSLNSEDLQKN